MRLAMGETAARRATTAAERCKNMVDETVEERRWFCFRRFRGVEVVKLRITNYLGPT